jgi:L-rhamnose mutarotase
MFNMEIKKANFINTTTALTVDSNSTTVVNMIDGNRDTEYASNGYSGATATNIIMTFSTPTVISRIYLVDHNLKDYSIFYDETTTNTFTLTGYSTSTIAYTGNSETSQYFVVSSQTVSTVYLRANEAMTASAEKVIADYYIGDLYHRFTQNPSADQYDPRINETSFNHKMSDGGTVRYFLADKFKASIQIPFVSSADRLELKTAYKSRNPLQFTPLPTESDWGGDTYEVNWVNGFPFQKFTSNIIGNGFTGQIDFEETPGR